MKSRAFGITVLALCLFLSITGRFTANSAGNHSVVIDAGHGGTDPGSTECAGYFEKAANLDIALQLKALLEADGIIVYMTRVDDSTLSNADRYNYANSTDGEVLVSIHLNGSTDHLVDGTLGLYGKRTKDLLFTEVVHSRLAQELGIADMGVTNFASGVLLKSDMPATIQEAVFISSESECAQLTDGTGSRQQQIAQALYHGIVDWLNQAQPPSQGGGGGGGRPDPPRGPK